MVARRAAFLAGLTLVACLTGLVGAVPASAAECTLTAPAYANVGTPVTIDGAGFPAATSIDVSIAVEGGPSDEFTLQSDASGALQLALTPEDVDIGVTTVRASAGADCTAEVTYTVLAAGATPPPATPEPDGASGADGAAAPRTNIIDRGGDASATGFPWAVAFALVVAGCLGLLLSRDPGRR